MKISKPPVADKTLSENIFQSKAWVSVFHYIMQTGLTPAQVRGILERELEHREEMQDANQLELFL